MAFDVLVDPGFGKELDRLADGDRAKVRNALLALANAPLENPKLARLHGSRYPGSFRMRIGPWRALGIVLASQRLVFLTTLFLKKRESDYAQALLSHEKRLAAQGPPLDGFLASARRKSP